MDCACHRIPEPIPDKTSSSFKYLHAKDTPHSVDGVLRLVDQYNPRVQLKKCFEEGVVKVDP